MGFLNSCWEALFQVSAYARVLSIGHDSQPPLELPGLVASEEAIGSSTGVSFPVPGANFTCNYPSMTGYVPCNGANDRSCWLKSNSKDRRDYTINTNYENMGPKGVTREYWLEVDLQPIAPDGYVKAIGLVFNQTYPGPHLQACWGDEMVIHVKNNIPNLGTTIHWHGIRQLHTNQQDGVNGVTQCPISFNQTHTYRFNVTQYGHTWYHSHYQTTYSDGIAGPLSIYGPSSASWDETSTPILMSDWVHKNSSEVFHQELVGGAPLSDSLLLGGKGTYECRNDDPLCCSSCNPLQSPCPPGVDPANCCEVDKRCTDPQTGLRLSGGTFSTHFVEGKRYLLKLVNAAAESMFIFSIDEHELEVIATDLVAIKPYKTTSVFIGIGQRYQVIVHAKPKNKAADNTGNYWIRTRIADGCGSVAQRKEKMGIVRYNAMETNSPTTHKQHHRTECTDEPVESLQPIISWNITDLQGDINDFTFDADIAHNATHGAFRWDLTNSPLFLNYSNPTILNTQNETYLKTPDFAVVDYPFERGFVYLVVNGFDLLNLKQNVSAAHPIHLHGHDFVILGQGNTTFPGKIPPLQTINPPRRDVAMLSSGGWLAMAFKPDNPGIWLVHCHIAWHASSGLALQVLERQKDILPSIGSLAEVESTCQGWDRFNLQFNQDDSGI